IGRLIVDVRGNIGGGLGSLRLMSYLCPGKVEIGHSLTRRRFRNGYRKESLTRIDRKSTRLNSSHVAISYAVFCLKKKKFKIHTRAVTYASCPDVHVSLQRHRTQPIPLTSSVAQNIALNRALNSLISPSRNIVSLR